MGYREEETERGDKSGWDMNVFIWQGENGNVYYRIGRKVVLISPLRHYRRWTLHSLGVAKTLRISAVILDTLCIQHINYTCCQ